MFKNFLLLVLSLFIFSCNSDDSITPIEDEATEEPAGFYALKVGNSWTYQGFTRQGALDDDPFEPDGVQFTTTIVDTVNIDGSKYFSRQTITTGNDDSLPCYPANGETVDHVRDSLGYLVNSEGLILYSERNFDAYLQFDNDWGDIYGKLEPLDVEITVPVGSFSCKQNTVYAVLEDSGEEAEGKNTDFYSDGIGQVYKTVATVSNPVHKWEYRLVSYDID